MATARKHRKHGRSSERGTPHSPANTLMAKAKRILQSSGPQALRDWATTSKFGSTTKLLSNYNPELQETPKKGRAMRRAAVWGALWPQRRAA